MSWLRARSSRALLLGVLVSVTLGMATAHDGARPVLDRVVVIGASASDGFRATIVERQGDRTAVEGIDLRDAISLAVEPDPSVLVSYATRSMFLAPHRIGESEISHAINERPTLVVALDFLFWYLYGTTGVEGVEIGSESDRLLSLEVGLEQLDRVLGQAGGPMLVVGDIPDVSGANSPMLAAIQIPASATIEQANARLREWAGARTGRVAIVPLHTLTAQALAGNPTTFGGVAWSPSMDGSLVQADRLHPTFAGLVALWARALESLRDAGADVGTGHQHDPRVHAESIRARLRRELSASGTHHPDVAAPAQTPPSN